jgi:tetratricopeptide (TPR) repeat protein
MKDSRLTMPLGSRIAALHGALWRIDRGYRLWWYVWPLAMAVLICGWIYLEKPMHTAGSTSAEWGKPRISTDVLAGSGAAGNAKRPATQLIAVFPEKLRGDAQTCYSTAPDKDKRPLIEACSRMIGSGLLTDEQSVAAHNQRGLYYYATTQRDLAMADYDAALKIQPDTPAVLTNRSLIYMENGQSDAALSDLNKAFELSMPALAARVRLYRATALLGLKQDDKAIADIDEAQRLDPTDSEGYLARALVEFRRQRYDAALRAYDEYGRRSPQHLAIGLIGRAMVLEATGRPSDALLAYENVLKLEPANRQAMAARERLRSAHQPVAGATAKQAGNSPLSENPFCSQDGWTKILTSVVPCKDDK